MEGKICWWRETPLHLHIPPSHLANSFETSFVGKEREKEKKGPSYANEQSDRRGGKWATLHGLLLYTISPSISFDAADAPFPIFSPALIFPPTRRSVTCTVHIRRRLRRRGLYYAIEAHALLCPNIVSEDTKLHPGPCIIHSEGETLIPARRWRTFHLIPPCCCWYVCSIGTIYNSLDLLIKKSTARSRTTVAGKGKWWPTDADSGFSSFCPATT